MIADYGMEGYGRYWVIVEMLREEADHRLEISAPYIRNALAVQMQCDPDAAHKFIEDCIEKYQLFETDGDDFWSNSLLRRMDLRKARSEQARRAAMARWDGKEKTPKNADAMRQQCDRNARKERKGKERERKVKERESKTAYASFVKMTPAEHQKLVEKFGDIAATRMIEILDNYKGANGKKYKSDYRAILSWVVDRWEEEGGNHRSRRPADSRQGTGDDVKFIYE